MISVVAKYHWLEAFKLMGVLISNGGIIFQIFHMMAVLQNEMMTFKKWQVYQKIIIG